MRARKPTARRIPLALATALGLLLAALALLQPAAARAAWPPAVPALPDWDVRGPRDGVIAPRTPAQARGLDALRKESAPMGGEDSSPTGGEDSAPPGGEIVLVPGPEPGSLHHLFRRAGALGAAEPRGSARAPEEIALAFVLRHRALLGLDEAGGRALELRRVVIDPGTLAAHVALQQRWEGWPVLGSELRVHLDRHGRVLSVAGPFLPVAPAAPAEWMDAPRALAFAAMLAGAPGQEPAPAVREVDADGIVHFEQGGWSSAPWAWRAWFPMDGRLRPAWIVVLDVPGGSWYQLAVDGATGDPLQRIDMVDHAEASGLVFRQDPDRGPQVSLPFVDDAALTDPASPLGWSAAGLTEGNNCIVREDLDGDNENTPGRLAAAQPGPPLTFDFPFQDDPALDLDASMTNLFWLNNWLHDRLVRMGFDEASGNFQAVNFSGQGRGGDAVRVDAQDGSGRNNANFGTPPDGFPPRMQMFTWTFTSPWRDSGFDGSVVTHEYFHGVSSRLVGLAGNDAGCLGGAQGGAMGEAWSDFFPSSFWNTPVVGAYVIGNPVRGIRRAPYDDHPYGYGDLCNQGAFQVHRDGEIWAATLWDLRELFIAADPRSGRCRLERLVLDGMKLSPCRPTYVDMRDAILLAARLRGRSGDTCLLWQGFAGRGLGVGAVSRGDCTSPADASHDMPPECASCGALAPPSGLALDAGSPNRPNQIVARFTPSPGAAGHVLLRAPGGCPGACAEAPFEEVAWGGPDATELVVADLPGDPMSAGDRFAFRVAAIGGACTALGDCAEATVIGRCTLPPVPAGPPLPAGETAGIVALTRLPQAGCALRVEWLPSEAACGASQAILYNVYRFADPGFTPDPSHLLASVPGPALSFIDASVPSEGATYVVRAEDRTSGGDGPHGGNEDGGTARLTAAPLGPVDGTTAFADDAESGELPGYRRTGTLPVNDWGIVSDANTRGGSAWHATGVEGGNADKNLHLPPLWLGAAPRLRFQHAFWFEDGYDGGVIEISVDGGRTWRDLIDDIVAGGYETARGEGFTRTVADLLNDPNDDRLWTGQNASGFPVHDLVEVDLAPYAFAQEAQIRFRLLVDPLAIEPGGWYVDDIVVEDVLAFRPCASQCADPPVAALPDAVACVSAGAPSFAVLDASGSGPSGGWALRETLPMVFRHEGPGTFGGSAWAPGPVAVLEMPAGTPAGDYPVSLVVRDIRGCESSALARVTVRDEGPPPAPVGPTLRVAREGDGLRLDWTSTGAAAHAVHVAPLGPGLAAGLGMGAPWALIGAPPAVLDRSPLADGQGSVFVTVFSASDCGRSVGE